MLLVAVAAAYSRRCGGHAATLGHVAGLRPAHYRLMGHATAARAPAGLLRGRHREQAVVPTTTRKPQELQRPRRALRVGPTPTASESAAQLLEFLG